MIKRNVSSRTKAKGCLYYIKDVGTLEQDNVTKVLMGYHNILSLTVKQDCSIGMRKAGILALDTWLVSRTGFWSKRTAA